MIVRALRRDEATLLRDLRLRALVDAPAAFAHTHAEIAAKPGEYWDEMTTSVTSANVLFVAEEGDRPLGMAFGILQHDRPELAHLGGMWVDPGARSAGVGRALTSAVLEWARARGFERIGLWVTEGNAPAIALYERMEFRRSGRRDQHPVYQDLDIVEMERAL